VAWPHRLFPIPLAFDTAGRRRVSAGDSAAFWEIARALDRALGEQVFRPAPAGELLGETDGVLVRVSGGMGLSGLTLISWTERGHAYDGAVHLRSRPLLRDARVVAHELVHALGFGHTSRWPSIMGPSSPGIALPTATDVAHMHLLLRLQAVQHARDAPYGVAEAVERLTMLSGRR
jgi:hypothetical protein